MRRRRKEGEKGDEEEEGEVILHSPVLFHWNT